MCVLRKTYDDDDDAASSRDPTLTTDETRRLSRKNTNDNGQKIIKIYGASAQACVYDEQCDVLPGAVNLDGRLGESASTHNIIIIIIIIIYVYTP